MKICDACQYYADKGFYPSQTHHCRTCHRSWTGITQAHCTRCHAHFSTSSAFDRHMTDEGCRNPENMKDIHGIYILGLRVDKWGRTWSYAGDGTPWWLAQHEMPGTSPEDQAPSMPATFPDLGESPSHDET